MEGVDLTVLDINMDMTANFVSKFIGSSWTGMNIRCGKYKHLQTAKKCKSYRNISIKITRDEFKSWCIEQEDAIRSLKRPSIDRIDNGLDYSLDNMQIIELSDNIRKDKTVFINGHGTCFKCKSRKIESEFCREKRRLNGRSNICLECERKRGREKYAKRLLKND